MQIARQWTRFDHHVLEGLLGLGVLLAGVFGALVPLLGVTGPLPAADTRMVDIDGRAQVPGSPASGGMVLRGTHHAELALSDPDFGERLLLAGPGIVRSLLIAWVLYTLMRMAQTLRQGDVFVPANTRRLGRVAAGVLLVGTAVPLLDTLTTDGLVGGTPLDPAVRDVYAPSLGAVLLALLVFAAAGAFGHGTRLRADTEGLV
ncbi:DUF2975 domain-containing protein [Actinomadura fibrosa]|uniref:DUF2975 domain-containing protein n=1 Tax=Actinomadura fibrosa TaxID=111802 RepID=A0ABW2XH71_9ACTN|nr:DUF2975 domain-containing protein [Actinomadura fibrosa]